MLELILWLSKAKDCVCNTLIKITKGPQTRVLIDPALNLMMFLMRLIYKVSFTN